MYHFTILLLNYYCTMEPLKIILAYYHCCDRCGKTRLVWLLSVSKSRMLGVAGIGLVPISESVKQGPDFAAVSDSVNSVISSKWYKTFFNKGTVPRKKTGKQSHHSPCWSTLVTCRSFSPSLSLLHDRALEGQEGHLGVKPASSWCSP